MTRGLRILVLEDEPDTRLAVKRFLEYRGHIVATAKTRAGAVEMAGVLNPEMLICDWKLGDEDGVEVVQQLKSRRNIPVVMVTAQRLSQVRQKARECNVDVAAFRRKPVSLPDLARLVEGLVRSG